MRLDPRLADLALLRLAAYRLRHGPPRLPPWQETEGLCALLEAAKRLPPCDPEALAAGTGPFAQLLREARLWTQRAHDQEA